MSRLSIFVALSYCRVLLARPSGSADDRQQRGTLGGPLGTPSLHSRPARVISRLLVDFCRPSPITSA